MKIYYLSILLYSFFSLAQNSGEVLIQGKLLKSKSGKLYLYEFLGNDSFIIDSTNVSPIILHLKQKFVKGFYKLAFQNETNNIEFVINPKETNVLNMTFNEYRLSSNYTIANSRDNKAKKIFNKKKNEIERNINKAKRDASKSVEMRKKEVQKLNKEMEMFSSNLAKEYSGTYTSLVLSKRNPPNVNDQNKFFDDINFNDESIVRSDIIPTRIQKYMVTHVKYNPKNNKYAFYDAVDYIMDKAKSMKKLLSFVCIIC